MAARLPFSEAQFDAAALTLLAQPRLWPALKAPDAGDGPWARYWATRRDGRLPAARAREAYARCAEAFERSGQTVGLLLALAAGIETYYVEEGALHPLDDWVARLQAQLPADDAWPSAELEAQVMACGLAITLRDQSHPLLARWAARALPLLRRLASGAVRTKLATFVLQYHLWRGEIASASLIVDALPGVDPAGLLPAEALVWYESVIGHARFVGQAAPGRAALKAALALSRRHHLRQHDYALHSHGAALEIAAGDAAAAKAHIEAMRPLLVEQALDDQTHYWHLQAGLALLQGDAFKAVALARTTLQNSLEIGGPYRSAAHRFSLAQALLCAQQPAEALPLLDAVVQAADKIEAGLLAFSGRLARSAAQQALQHGPEADEELRRALRSGAARDHRHSSGWWLPTMVAERLQRALQLGIEPAYVRRWIRERDLPCPRAPSAPAPLWPWPLTLRGFGELQILRDDEPLNVGTGRVAQRPLDLLRALLAHAPAPLPVATALQWLWPDAQGADQRKAFDVALLRLRRLLGDARLLKLEGAQLSLAADRVWTDVHALAFLSQQIAGAPAAEPERLAEWSAALTGLVRGPLLTGFERPWAQGARARQRQRFVLGVQTLAQALARDDGDAARDLLERAMDADPAAEAIARRLMQLHVDQGRPAEGQRVLDLAAAMVQLETGLPLAPETARLAARLGLLGP